MTYLAASLVILAVAQTTAILILVHLHDDRLDHILSQAAHDREVAADRLMAVMSDEDNPLFASVQATGLRMASDVHRPVANTTVSYVDEEREYELQRSGNGNDEETSDDIA